MKLLFDEDLSFKHCERLAGLFPGSSQVRLLGLVQAEDRAIWNYAGRNGFTLVSLDVDFADRAILIAPATEGHPASLRQTADRNHRKIAARSFRSHRRI